METIRTDELVARQLGVDMNTAAALIMEGRIWIGNVPAEKPGSPLPADTVITCREKAKKYASRSGYKLEKALAHFHVDPADRIVCDIGASNGGFTDFIEKNFICRSALTDRTGASFPLLGMYDCSNVLYNSVPLYMADRLDTLYSTGVSTLHFIFSTENKAEVRNVIHAYKNGLPPADPSAVRRIK